MISKRGPKPGTLVKAAVTYNSAHSRVTRARGSASGYQCVDCSGPATDWSYDHADPAELISDHPKTLGAPYSVDPAHYVARCKPCHNRFDRHT